MADRPPRDGSARWPPGGRGQGWGCARDIEGESEGARGEGSTRRRGPLVAADATDGGPQAVVDYTVNETGLPPSGEEDAIAHCPRQLRARGPELARPALVAIDPDERPRNRVRVVRDEGLGGRGASERAVAQVEPGAPRTTTAARLGLSV